jgi:hypothetical protein
VQAKLRFIINQEDLTQSRKTKRQETTVFREDPFVEHMAFCICAFSAWRLGGLP